MKKGEGAVVAIFVTFEDNLGHTPCAAPALRPVVGYFPVKSSC
jgi:hypothetical protein